MDPGYAVRGAADAVVDRFHFPVLHDLENELGAHRRTKSSRTCPRAKVQALYALKQKLICRATPSGRCSKDWQLHRRSPVVCAGMQEYFRDVSDHLLRLSQTIESVHDTIATAISVNLSMITLAGKRDHEMPAAYAALIAVPTLIAGIYGMNFSTTCRSCAGAVATAVGVMALVDSYLFYRLRKAKWL